jgi:Protein of unknown function (DUF4230)
LRGQRHAVHRAGHRYRLHRLLSAPGPVHPGQRGSHRGHVKLPKAQLEPAVLNVSPSYLYAEQQGLFNRIGNIFSGDPNSQQQVYAQAQQKTQAAAAASPPLTEAQQNAEGMLTSLGFQQVTVTFGATAS